jgi:hypothetical protein
MLDDGSDDDAQCHQIREENGALLGEFSTWLADAGPLQARSDGQLERAIPQQE